MQRDESLFSPGLPGEGIVPQIWRICVFRTLRELSRILLAPPRASPSDDLRHFSLLFFPCGAVNRRKPSISNLGLFPYHAYHLSTLNNWGKKQPTLAGEYWVQLARVILHMPDVRSNSTVFGRASKAPEPLGHVHQMYKIYCIDRY